MLELLHLSFRAEILNVESGDPQESLGGFQGSPAKRKLINFTMTLSISHTMTECMAALVMGFVHCL